MLWLTLSRFVHNQSKGSALDSEADSWHSGHGDSSAFLQLGSSSRWFSPAFVPQVPPGSLPPALLTLLVLEAPPWNCGDLVALSLPILLLLECELFFLYFFFKRFCLWTISYTHIAHFLLPLNDISVQILLAQRGLPCPPLGIITLRWLWSAAGTKMGIQRGWVFV